MYESFVKTIISSVNNWLKSWIYGFAVKKLSFLMENGIMLRDFRLVEYLKRKKPVTYVRYTLLQSYQLRYAAHKAMGNFF